VHTASILAGNIGSTRRMKYGLLGDGVNSCARFKGLNTRYNTQTVCSAVVREDELSARRAVFRPLDMVAVKGKTEPITVYEIIGFAKGHDEAGKMKEAAQKHSEAFKLYHDRRFKESRSLFTELARDMQALKSCLRLDGGERDQPALQMRRRCKGYIKDPPGPEWDGVERLKAKTFEVFDDALSDDDENMVEMPKSEGDVPRVSTSEPSGRDASRLSDMDLANISTAYEACEDLHESLADIDILSPVSSHQSANGGLLCCGPMQEGSICPSPPCQMGPSPRYSSQPLAARGDMCLQMRL